MHAIYERITVAEPEIVGVRLTAVAYAHGLALALPEKVVMARPTGVERALDRRERRMSHRMVWLLGDLADRVIGEGVWSDLAAIRRRLR
jgi:hypothetical protein